MKDYNFGDYSIVGSVTHNFEKAPQWWWKIRPVTSGDELEITNFIYRNRDIQDGNGNWRYIPPPNLEICHREIAMLFDGSNIPDDKDNPVEDGGKPLLAVDANLAEIETVLRNMPQPMVFEIWQAISIANPDGKWGPGLPNSEEKGTQPEND